MIESAERVIRYTGGMTLESFLLSDITVDTVLRNLEIIGEAARYVPAEIQERYSDVPWSGMRGMRKILIHAYDAVELEVVWETTQVQLPAAVPELRQILEESPA